MKTKLTLTIRKSTIKNARQYSKQKGKSISQLFEEYFEQNFKETKTKPQLAAERLLKRLEKAKPIKTLNDKELLRLHVAKKYA